MMDKDANTTRDRGRAVPLITSVMTVLMSLLMTFAMKSSVAVGAESGIRPPLDPAAGWAIAYLVNASLIAEYEAVRSSLPEGAAATAFLRGADGQALWVRASFAAASLKAKEQAVPTLAATATALAEQRRLFASQAAEIEGKLTHAATSLAAPEDDAPAQAGHALIAATFRSEALRELWPRLARAYGLPAPVCAASGDVHAFAARQRELLNAGRALSDHAILQPMAGWTLPRVRCLASALMVADERDKMQKGYDPLHLLLAFERTASPMARDVSIKALTAVRLLHLTRYGEALRLIMDLTELDPGFRLPYEVVQRVFSLKQKGEGAVALRGL